MSDSTAVAVRGPASSAPVSVWQSPASFEAAQRMANALVNSPMVPDAYRGPNNMGSALIALDIAQRINASPLMVMQNLHIIQGRPSWGASFIIAALNACGKFSPLRFRLTNRGEQSVSFTEWTGPKGERQRVTKTMKVTDMACVATAVEHATGEILEGPEVSVAMAVAEGWYTKNDSKWVTMPDLMLRYRAAAFFGRLYAPDLLMGMQTEQEVHDVVDVDYSEVKPAPAAAAPAAVIRSSRVAAVMNDAAAPTTQAPGRGNRAEASAEAAAAETAQPAEPRKRATQPAGGKAKQQARRDPEPEPQPDLIAADQGDGGEIDDRSGPAGYDEADDASYGDSDDGNYGEMDGDTI